MGHDRTRVVACSFPPSVLPKREEGGERLLELEKESMKYRLRSLVFLLVLVVVSSQDTCTSMEPSSLRSAWDFPLYIRGKLYDGVPPLV